MDLFDGLTLVGGLSLFLFGMNLMGQALERRAGGKLRSLLGKLTTNKAAGLLTGLGITAVIQSSSATTVMVVGFVNSGLMVLRQAIHVIMGANIGTTVTAWLLSLAGIESNNFFVQLLKPTSFTPVLALIGIIFYMFCKNPKKKDTGMILLGFATLMFGMDAMSGAVSGLRDVPAFQNLFVMFQNPLLGVLAGMVLTAVIQSSSASVGILQTLALTGQISYSAAIPIIMGQNIGTCVTAMISSVGATKNGKRTALVHLLFNVLGTVVWLAVFWVVDLIFRPALLAGPASPFGIAVAHSIFNVLCVILMIPLSGVLERLVTRLIPDAKRPEEHSELDERLLTTPPIALQRCQEVAADMTEVSMQALQEGLVCVKEYDAKLAESIREKEEKTDHYEDMLGTYLVKLSACQISQDDSAEAAKLLKIIGDVERISDHAVGMLEGAEEMRGKGLTFSEAAAREWDMISAAVSEIVDLTQTAFVTGNLQTAYLVEPLAKVIEQRKEQMRMRHILRLQQGLCSIDVGFIWSDLLTAVERTCAHCSNLAACLIDMEHHHMNLHESQRDVRHNSPAFQAQLQVYAKKYPLTQELPVS